MVLAEVFRGPDAEKLAAGPVQQELRQDFELPAYILRTKDFPTHKIVLNNPPGGVRTHDEAAVLVGNEKDVASIDIREQGQEASSQSARLSPRT